MQTPSFDTIPQMLADLNSKVDRVLEENEKILKLVPEENPRKIMNARQLSEYLELSLISIYRMTSGNLIPFKKIGARVVFRKDVIDEWLEGGRVNTIELMRKAEEPI